MKETCPSPSCPEQLLALLRRQVKLQQAGKMEGPPEAARCGYMANAWIRMRHPDFDTLRHMLDDVGRTVHVHAS